MTDHLSILFKIDTEKDLTVLEKEENMTTTVIVKANHGWPVEVVAVHPESDETIWSSIVNPNSEQTFSVHSTADLHIHEIQPGELAAVPADI